MPVAAFTPEGQLISANDVARPLLHFQNLVDAGLDDARNEALKQGAVATAIEFAALTAPFRASEPARLAAIHRTNADHQEVGTVFRKMNSSRGCAGKT